ncbi:MAG: hypothetical protein KJN71_06885 [Acidimicrobiia bacterium]|nr:hypothetical protein [Acidimicrobiia bacterium]
MAAVFVGLVGIAGTTFSPPNTGADVVVLALAVVSLVAGLVTADRRGWSHPGVRFLVAAGSLAVIAVQAGSSAGYFRVHIFLATAAVAAVLGAVALVRGVVPLRWALLLVVAAVTVVAAASGSLLRGDVPDIDVVQLHDQAVGSLLDGRNPYSTGNVAVMETKPLGDNELIEEYTYPPINLVWYALGNAVNGDVRTGGAIALVLAIAVFSLVAIRQSHRLDGTVGTFAIAGVAFLISNQAMYYMVSAGWTEVTALPFFFLAVLWWRRLPVPSAIALGLALASKQYFVLAVPVLLVLPDAWRFRRVAIATVSATATLVPFLIWDARGLIDGMVIHHLTRDPRPDSATVANLGIEIPSIVAVAAAVALGVWIARRADGPAVAILGVAASLAVFTLLAIRGFVNSWWLVYCLVTVALLMLAGRGTSLDSDRTSDRRSDSV